MRVLERGVFGDEPFGIGERRGDMAFGFEPGCDLGHGVDAPNAPAVARGANPIVEPRAVGVVEVPEQRAAHGGGVAGEPRLPSGQVVLDNVREREDVAGGYNLAAAPAAQLEQALPQAAAL